MGAHLLAATGIRRMVLDELCSTLFASLRRRDQRIRAAEYVRGLLETPGRKSMRNIAAAIGGKAAEQSLHHFINDSTWDWVSVRRALAGYLVETAPPAAWVVRPMIIPKVGEYSVGVARSFCPSLGQTLHGQHAFGVWAASEELRSPINWRLLLSDSWLEDRPRRVRASIPDELPRETMVESLIGAYAEAWHPALPALPVVFDSRAVDVLAVVRRLRAAAVPMMARVGSAVRLVPVGMSLPGYHATALPACQIMGATRELRRPLSVLDGTGIRTYLAAAVQVRLAREPGDAAGSADESLLLIGTSEIGEDWPTELWLTDLTHLSPVAHLRLARLAQRVDRDFERIADRVGIRDFVGRSFTGWHRHVTLASIAHTVVALDGETQADVASQG